MEEVIKKLTVEQLEYLEEIKSDYREMDTGELYEYLTEYFQKQGLEDIDSDPKQLLLESIIDTIAEE